VRRRAATAFAAATAAVRRHYQHHLVREEDFQLPPALVPKQLRADLRSVRRCDIVTGWSAAADAGAVPER